MTLEKALSQFLERHHDKKSPLLVGLSGGPDSLALFYLLHHYRDHPLKFAIAHLDHGWRQESAEESRHLQQLASELGIPFHFKKLDPQQMVGNLEEACRQARLAFFSALCVDFGYQAVILGHHADDQSETVLKKVMEGKGLPYLSGMAPTSNHEGLWIWRPLLNYKKSQIQAWLRQHGYQPFEDPTNVDPKFLRARFRTKIFPQLSQHFGKEIGSTLCRIGKEAEELRSYLDDQLQEQIQSIATGPFGAYLDTSNFSLSHFETRYLIRKVLDSEQRQLPRSLIDEIAQKLHEKAANCQFFTKNTNVYVDRGVLFILRKALTEFNQVIPITLGETAASDLKIIVTEAEIPAPHLSGWREVWKGQVEVSVPKGDYVLKKGDISLSTWWTQEKVPAFMRWVFPVLCSEKGIEHEFLASRPLKRVDKISNRSFFKITLIF